MRNIGDKSKRWVDKHFGCIYVDALSKKGNGQVAGILKDYEVLGVSVFLVGMSLAEWGYCGLYDSVLQSWIVQ